MECRVEFDYTAQEDDELTLRKNDVITNVVPKLDGWWEGHLNGKIGMFPDNFVKIIEKPANPVTPPEPVLPALQKPSSQSNVILRSNSNKTSRRLKALFSYSPEQDDELRLDVGDVIDYIAEVEEGWFRGRLRGKIGIFPSNFVADVDPADANSNGKSEQTDPKHNEQSKQSKVTTSRVREQGRCFYAYEAQNDDELSLAINDIVQIISKNCDDEGWWRGELRGKTGLFPDNFVKIISANESSTLSKQPSLNSTVTPGPKISPQERTNLIGVKPINSGVSIERTPSSGSDKNVGIDNINKGSTKKTNGVNDAVDGIGSSKPKLKEDGGQESVSSKVQRFSHMNLNPGMKPATPTSPVSSSGGVSPFSLSTTMNSSRDFGDDEEIGDFNSVERSENKLSHLTAGRAKAPRRRPPSTIIGKEGEENGINGVYNSHDSFESTPNNHSTPLNLSLNNSISQSNTPSNSMLDNSNVSENGSFDGSAGGSASKAKKVPPWMAELKQKQDKKALNSTTSPNTTTSLAGSPSLLTSSSTPLPHVTPTPPIAHAGSIEKETIVSTPAVKAPPLPAKPNTLVTSSNSIDKSSPTVVSPSTHLSGAPIVANRLLGKKPPAPGFIPNTNHSHVSNDMNGSDSKNHVSYEDYAKLRDRVIILEAELETVRRQVKLLLDRELSQGHIV
ncbi:SH3 domain-containing kinase-binding protein 1 isoform X2 [Folsomia candida]|uniref:SH3 domain-containing kinase-binding protein 1 isoform X2 n=1 Tax=Folsomia candida TaxID=158441 RepID=UPI000B8FF554|nr:SH3 domain-containing kinase-binding protein 1 isoform X2 [Folsomia candida]